MKNNMGHQQKIKAMRKDEKAKQADSVQRQKDFMKAVQDASSKYRCDLVAAIEYRKTAIVPTMVIVDVIDKYEHMTEEAKKAEAAKKAGETKNQPQDPQSTPVENPSPAVPKLEV